MTQRTRNISPSDWAREFLTKERIASKFIVEALQIPKPEYEHKVGLNLDK